MFGENSEERRTGEMREIEAMLEQARFRAVMQKLNEQRTGQSSSGGSAGTDLEKEQSITDLINTSPPVISGKNDVGELFTVNDGTWTGTLPITFTYQWKRNGTNIIGETNSTYTTVLADSGQTISCEVTATNITGSASALSNTATIL